MSTTSSSTVTTDRSSSSGQPVGLPQIGNVSKLRANWSVYEDGALAYRLQNEEITTHLQDNKRKNHQIRDDFPRALEEQTKEQDQVQRWLEERRKNLREQEKFDSEVARKVAMTDENQRRYEADRDRAFVERLQRIEQDWNQGRQRQPVVPQPGRLSGGPIALTGLMGLGSSGQYFQQPSPSTTPPLPVMSNGDVPSASMKDAFDDVLPHVRGGVRYNDEQYLIKLARPAVVTAEPVYANNRPEHYAVSAKFPQAETGAIAKTPRPLGPSSPDTPKASELLLGATGLSQKDLALSKRAEEQLEQERRDQELAKRLQEELNMEEEEDARRAREEQDLEYARLLQAKEQAKLKRAKERAKLKKLHQKQQQEDEELQQHQNSGEFSVNPHHERTQSQPLSLNVFGGAIGARAESRQSRRSDVVAQNGRHSRTSANSRSFEDDVRPPARRPYMNPGAIDSHRSEFATYPEDVATGDDDEDDVVSDDVESNEIERETEEPQYANVGPAAAQALREELAREIRLSYSHHGDSPIPPYMPLQQPHSKKSTSLEKRIKKKKEKEGCKQQ